MPVQDDAAVVVVPANAAAPIFTIVIEVVSLKHLAYKG
jgi:hypothetical protein